MANPEADLARFQRETEILSRQWFSHSSVEVERRYNFMRIRVHVIPATFIELYYNAQNGRGSYALIHNQKRIFGYDGVKEWHRHPFDNPEKHEPCAKPRLSKVLHEMKQIVDSLPAGVNNV